MRKESSNSEFAVESRVIEVVCELIIYPKRINLDAIFKQLIIHWKMGVEVDFAQEMGEPAARLAADLLLRLLDGQTQLAKNVANNGILDFHCCFIDDHARRDFRDELFGLQSVSF